MTQCHATSPGAGSSSKRVSDGEGGGAAKHLDERQGGVRMTSKANIGMHTKRGGGTYWGVGGGDMFELGDGLIWII